MLHALLHRKLDELIPEPQRREDALTSAVFGTLVLVSAWDLLAHWLGLVDQPIAEPSNNDLWFWPRLVSAEPDVVLRLGNWLVVVEAKYRSNRNDLVPTEEENIDLGDQLVRQYTSLTTSVDQRVRYQEALERAITECRLVQVLVIDASRRKARSEWEESRARLPKTADLRLASWQELFKLLSNSPIRQHRWAGDLCAYLQLCDLDTFNGIGHSLLALGSAAPIRDWRQQDVHSGWGSAVEELLSAGVMEILEAWRCRDNRDAYEVEIQRLDPIALAHARNVITGWHTLNV